MPMGSEQTFKDWWRSLDKSATVVICYPHQRHGNTGKQSNSAKTSTMNDFCPLLIVTASPKVGLHNLMVRHTISYLNLRQYSGFGRSVHMLL